MFGPRFCPPVKNKKPREGYVIHDIQTQIPFNEQMWTYNLFDTYVNI